MIKAYRIVEWRERYEVTDKGKPANENTPLERLRKSPLPYVRFKVCGHKLAPGYRKLVKKAWRHGMGMELAVFGLFGKLLELAADQPAGFRGWILDEKQRPIYADQIAEILEVSEVDVVKVGLQILTDLEIGWLELAEFCEDREPSPSIGGDLWGKKGEASGGKKGKLLNETETESKANLNEEKASDASHDVSDSADAIGEPRQKALRQVLILLRIKPDNPSDITTFRDIFEQVQARIINGELTTEVFDRVVDEAKDAASYRFKKTARFVNAMKREPFCYVPEHRKMPGSRYR